MRNPFSRVLPIVALLAAVITVAFGTNISKADDGVNGLNGKAANTIQQLAKAAKPSVVVVTFQGRDANQRGIGSGFVISPDGLIATNLHVIGEARPIQVQLADGRTFDVTEIHASERALDLAILRIKAKGLKPLPLGDASRLSQGDPLVALGNPHGLKHSVVSGVLSATRPIDGKPMLQLAIPVEPGNSGGPVLDRQGRVIGIMTLKSAVADNLGFAMPVDALKPLIAKPNPIPIKRWLTIGTLDPQRWKTVAGARWRQRAGRINVEGLGDGFGGRSLCVYQPMPPKGPYEVGTWVKLDNKAGAAGLIFASDGGNRHYGFYPTGGSLRLTRFEGANVFSWKIIQTLQSPHYRAGQFNYLKVRIDGTRIRCFVNDHLVIEAEDGSLNEGFKGGRVGLCKFRQTQAEFKGFGVGESLPPSQVSEKLAAQLIAKVRDLPAKGELNADLIRVMSQQGNATAVQSVLERRASELEAQAKRMRELAQAAHRQRIVEQIAQTLNGKPDKQPDKTPKLFTAALLVAKLDNAELDETVYLAELDRMAARVRAKLPNDADDHTKLKALTEFLFKDNGFHGSRTNYYNRSNSYLNEVIDDREGLPITLSVLFMEVGKQIGLRIEGVGLPGHFVVRLVGTEQSPLIDVFDGGRQLSQEDAAELVEATTGGPLLPKYLKPVSPRRIVHRMLRNLLGLTERTGDMAAASAYLDAMIAISAPQAPANKPGEADASHAMERWMRAVLNAQQSRPIAAVRDTTWLLENRPAGIDLRRVERLHQALQAQIDRN